MASDRPLAPWPEAADSRALRIDAIETPGTGPGPGTMLRRSPHLGLPYVYLARVGAECGCSCGIENPALRTTVHALLQAELSRGTRLELVFSHVDHVADDLEMTARITASGLLDVQQDWENRVQGLELADQPTPHGAVPMGDGRAFFRPRKIRFVTESELELRDGMNAPPAWADRRVGAHPFVNALGRKVLPEWMDWLMPFVFLLLVYLLYRWLV